MMKTLVLRFYEYIRYIKDILIDILTQNVDGSKNDQNSWKCKKKTFINEIKSTINILKFFLLA